MCGLKSIRSARTRAESFLAPILSGSARHNSFMTDYPDVPNLDEARQRLVRRFGDGVQSWMEELTGRLLVLRERWGLELDSVLPKGQHVGGHSVPDRARSTGDIEDLPRPGTRG
jgi:hypothetical protein